MSEATNDKALPEKRPRRKISYQRLAAPPKNTDDHVPPQRMMLQDNSNNRPSTIISGKAKDGTILVSPRRSRSFMSTTNDKNKSKVSTINVNKKLGRSLSLPRSPKPGQALRAKVNGEQKSMVFGNMDKLLGLESNSDEDDDFFAGLDKALGAKGTPKTSTKERSKFVDNPHAQNTPYKTLKQSFNGEIEAIKLNIKEVKREKISKGIEEFKQHPDKYLGLYYYVWMKSQSLEDQQYALILRDGTQKLKIDFDNPKGDRTIWIHTKGEAGVTESSYEQALEEEAKVSNPSKFKKVSRNPGPINNAAAAGDEIQSDNDASTSKKRPRTPKEKKEYQANAQKNEQKARNQRLDLNKRLYAQAEARANATASSNKKNGTVVRIPKRSAILAVSSPEVDEYHSLLRQERLAQWQAKAGDEWEILCDQTFDGVATSECTREESRTFNSVDEAIETFMEDPDQYRAMFFPATRIKKPDNKKVEVTLVIRAGTLNYKPLGVRDGDGGIYALFQHHYRRLIPFKEDLLPKKFRDAFTNDLTFKGQKLHSKKKEKRKPILPGRGMGLGDTPTMTFIGDMAEPNDVVQGTSVGNCWLLSAIACLADFDFAIQRLFRKTAKPPVLSERPTNAPNQYIVTLWDLPRWKEVDIMVDEQLPVCSDNSGNLLGAKPSKGGKFWVPYLEKAIAQHCGGYEKLIGGNCTNAWPMLTGSRNQYILTRNVLTKRYRCSARFDVYKQEWSHHTNSPHDCEQMAWEVEWPKVGGGGARDEQISPDDLFHKLVAWDKHNYLIGASTDGVSDKNSTDGLVDNHAYSIIDTRSDVCSTGIDLLLIRNPWGEGGDLKNSLFGRDGAGWKRYPDIHAKLKPSKEDNGMCWITKEEFFDHFPTIYVSAVDTARLKDPGYVNDLADDFPRDNPGSERKTAEDANSVVSDDSSSIDISDCSSVDNDDSTDSPLVVSIPKKKHKDSSSHIKKNEDGGSTQDNKVKAQNDKLAGSNHSIRKTHVLKRHKSTNDQNALVQTNARDQQNADQVMRAPPRRTVSSGGRIERMKQRLEDDKQRGNRRGSSREPLERSSSKVELMKQKFQGGKFQF